MAFTLPAAPVDDSQATLNLEEPDGSGPGYFLSPAVNHAVPNTCGVAWPGGTTAVACTWGAAHLAELLWDGSNFTVKLDGVTIDSGPGSPYTLAVPNIGLSIIANDTNAITVNSVAVDFV